MNTYIDNTHSKKQGPTDINVLKLRVLTNTFKITKIQDDIHIVLNVVKNVNLKNRIYFTFYSTNYVTALQTACSF